MANYCFSILRFFGLMFFIPLPYSSTFVFYLFGMLSLVFTIYSFKNRKWLSLIIGLFVLILIRLFTLISSRDDFTKYFSVEELRMLFRSGRNIDYCKGLKIIVLQVKSRRFRMRLIFFWSWIELKDSNNGGSSRACGGDHRHYRLLGLETRTVAKQAHSLSREIGKNKWTAAKQAHEGNKK